VAKIRGWEMLMDVGFLGGGKHGGRSPFHMQFLCWLQFLRWGQM